MYSSLTAAVLCISMQAAAAAQCVAPEPVAQHTASADQMAKTPAPAATAPRAGGELIKTASAGTHDEIPGLTRSAPAAAGPQEDDQHHRGGPAMLLAALALMSGIALRRFGAHKQ